MAGTTSADHRSPPTNHHNPLYRSMIGQIHQRSSSRGHDRSGSTTATSLVPFGHPAKISIESTVSGNDSNRNGEETNAAQAGGSNNVGELVVKAKKAAASLWMILHAQSCHLPQDQCPYTNCSETKLILAHVKNCPAGPNFPCPSKCKGCNETRKLLTHYRRCKDMRMKQVGTGRRGTSNSSQQSCLVCSLMARHAKVMMEKHHEHLLQQKQQQKQQVAVEYCCTVGSVYHTVGTPRFGSPRISLSSSSDGKFNVEKGFASIPNSKVISSTIAASTKDCSSSIRPSPAKKKVERSPSMLLMPPPPPRPRSEVMTSPPPYYEIGNRNIAGLVDTKNSLEPELYYFGSPQNPSQLIHPSLTAVTAVTDPYSTKTNTTSPSLLGKSDDSSSDRYSVPKRRSSLNDDNRSSDSAATTTNVVNANVRTANDVVVALNNEALEQMALPTDPASSSSSTIPSSLQHRRQRSVSYDERRNKNSTVSWAPNFITESRSYHPDEFDEHPSSVVRSAETENDFAETSSAKGQQSDSAPRPRSASCGGGIIPPYRPLTDASSSSLLAVPACEPIEEEEGVMADCEETIFDRGS
ncbi:hypothetical protein ACHAXS_012512 [Conticribra weissflogii]